MIQTNQTYLVEKKKIKGAARQNPDENPMNNSSLENCTY